MRRGLSTLVWLFGLAIKPVIFAISLLVPRDDRRWVFMTGDGERFADNSKYLYLHCAETVDVRNIWISTAEETVAELRAEGYEAYLAGSLRGKYHMLRAGVYFETHGPIAPEYTGRARLVHLTHGNYLKAMLNDHTRDWPWIVDLAVDVFFERRRRYVVTADGPPLENTMSMRDAPEERMLITGFPRNDVLFEEHPGERLGLDESALEEFLTTAREGPVFLYAPTHRTAYGEHNGIPLSELDLGFDAVDQVLETHGGHLYVSPHPASTIDRDFADLEHVSMLDTGGDLYPFLRACDALLTDYSGIFYDFLLLDRPVVFYAPDLEAYTSDRELYFEYEEHVPGPVATDSAALLDAIADVLDGCDQYRSDREQVRDEFYADPDSSASERVYRAIAAAD